MRLTDRVKSAFTVKIIRFACPEARADRYAAWDEPFRRRDPDRIPLENLRRREARARRCQLRRPARADLRPARPERRGQVDADQHPRRTGREDQRQGDRLGLRHRRASAQRQALDRHRAAGNPVRPLLHAARSAGDPGRPLRNPARAAAHDGAARSDAPHRQGRCLCAHLVRRNEAPPAGGQGDGPCAADPRARRADGRRGHRASPPALGLCAGTERGRRHGRPDHALSRRSGRALRPDRDHQPGPRDRQRTDAGAGGQGAGKGSRRHLRS